MESKSIWRQSLILAILGAALSLLVTGYVFGISNNLFHLPIVSELYNEPQYKDDAFIQSLRYFSSGVWILLRGSARHINPFCLFFTLDYFSRFLSFLGFLLCASLLGVRRPAQGIVFTALICFTSILLGSSAAGGGGLFLNYFTHSEMANGTILLAIYFAVQSRVIFSFIFMGLTFFVNVFMGVWLAVPLGFLAVSSLLNGKIILRKYVIRYIIGILLFGLIAFPVILNIVSNPEFGVPLNFDYKKYLLFYFPYHFLPSENPFQEYIALAAVTLVGLMAFIEIGPSAKHFRTVFYGFMTVYVFGLIIPFLSTSASILNLHLLRSSVVIYLLSALGASSVASNWLFDKDRDVSKIFGPALAFAICANRYLFPLVFVAILLKRSPWGMRRASSLPRLDISVLLVLVFIACPCIIYSRWHENKVEKVFVSEWEEVGRWAYSETPVSAVFLMPTDQGHRGFKLSSDRSFSVPKYSQTFEYFSHRRVRGDFKRGAAVMWTPSYYKEWRSEIDDGLLLQTLSEKMAYSKLNHIDYVILDCQHDESRQISPIFQTEHICVFSSADKN